MFPLTLWDSRDWWPVAGGPYRVMVCDRSQFRKCPHCGDDVCAWIVIARVGYLPLLMEMFRTSAAEALCIVLW